MAYDFEKEKREAMEAGNRSAGIRMRIFLIS